MMRQAVEKMARTVAEHLGKQEIRGRTVTLKIRLAPFRTFTRSRTLAEPTADPGDVADAALALFDAFERDAPVRLLGVGISNLVRGRRRRRRSGPRPRRRRCDGGVGTRAARPSVDLAVDEDRSCAAEAELRPSVAAVRSNSRPPT